LAKTKVTTRKYYVPDLVRSKPKTNYLEIPVYRVDVNIEVTTKGILSASEVPSSKMDRLEKAATEALEKYEDIISSETARLDKKITELFDKGDPEAEKEALSLLQGVNMSIKNALKSAEGAAQQAVEARLKKEAQGDRNLTEARVRTVITFTTGVITLSAAAGRLVASMGADVTAYISAGKTLITLGLEIHQMLKDEEALRKDLMKGIQTYIKLRGTVVMQAIERQGIDTSGIDISHPIDTMKVVAGKIKSGGEEVLKGRDAKAVLGEVMDFAVKGVKAGLNDVEKARTKYRDHTVKTRHKTDDMSSAADKLMKATKGATTLKEGVKLGAKAMEAKRAVTVMAKKLDQREKFLEEMQELMKGNGLSIDDRTTIQKLKELDLMTMASEGATILGVISDIKSIVEVLV
jgi:hypothetical protein